MEAFPCQEPRWKENHALCSSKRGSSRLNALAPICPYFSETLTPAKRTRECCASLFFLLLTQPLNILSIWVEPQSRGKAGLHILLRSQREQRHPTVAPATRKLAHHLGPAYQRSPLGQEVWDKGSSAGLWWNECPAA